MTSKKLIKGRHLLGVAAAGVAMTLAVAPFGVLRAQDDAAGKADDAASEPMETHGETLDEATEQAEAEAVAEAAPSEAPQSVMVALLSDLNGDNVKEKVETFYDPTATLEDPFGRYERRAEVAEHLTSLFAGAKSIAFEVRSEFQSGDEAMTLWTVSVVHPRLRGDEPVVVEGVTHARLVNGKIAEQRDYYDAGALVYENVTFVGSLVRWVKAKASGR